MFGQSALAFALLPELAVFVREHTLEKNGESPLTAENRTAVRLYASVIGGGLAVFFSGDILGLILSTPIINEYANRFLPEGALKRWTERLKHPHVMLAAQLVLAYIGEGFVKPNRLTLPSEFYPY